MKLLYRSTGGPSEPGSKLGLSVASVLPLLSLFLGRCSWV